MAGKSAPARFGVRAGSLGVPRVIVGREYSLRLNVYDCVVGLGVSWGRCAKEVSAELAVMGVNGVGERCTDPVFGVGVQGK